MNDEINMLLQAQTKTSLLSKSNEISKIKNANERIENKNIEPTNELIKKIKTILIILIKFKTQTSKLKFI